MTLRKELKIAIIENDEKQRKVYEKYVAEICKNSGYPLGFNIKQFGTYHLSIEEMDNDLDITLLNTNSSAHSGREHIKTNEVIGELERNTENCDIILLSNDREKAQELKSKYDSIYSVVDTSEPDYYYLGKNIHDLIKKHGDNLGPQKVM